VLAVKIREGLSFAQTAKRFSIGIASVVRRNARLAPKPYQRRAPVKLDMAALAQDVRDPQDAYQHERAARGFAEDNLAGAAAARGDI